MMMMSGCGPQVHIDKGMKDGDQIPFRGEAAQVIN